jgi:hypothetical protein
MTRTEPIYSELRPMALPFTTSSEPPHGQGSTTYKLVVMSIRQQSWLVVRVFAWSPLLDGVVGQ